MSLGTVLRAFYRLCILSVFGNVDCVLVMAIYTYLYVSLVWSRHKDQQVRLKAYTGQGCRVIERIRIQ